MTAGLLQHALHAADTLGPVFPRHVEGVGLYQATRDPDALRAMWRPWVRAFALACEPAGVMTLDVDTKGADGFASLATLEAEHGPLPATWKASTPSGGAHLYFRHPPRPIRNRTGFHPGLDLKATGGSITLPPSTKPNGAYVWTAAPGTLALADPPRWLLDIVAPPEPPWRPSRPLTLPRSADRLAAYVGAALDGEVAAVLSLRMGRNTRLFQAGANLGELVGAGLLPRDMAEDALRDAAEGCGLLKEDGRRSVEATIASGMKRGMAHPREIAA